MHIVNVVTHKIQNMKQIIILISLISILSCQRNTRKNIVIVKNDKTEISIGQKCDNKESDQKTFKDDSVKLNGFLGILRVYNYSAKKLIIQNPDNSIFKTIEFGPESEEYYKYLVSAVSQFDMYSFKPDYNLFIFNCNKIKDFYEIKTKDNRSKLISDSSEYCKFQTWTEFLMSDNYVSIGNLNNKNDFDIFKNPNDSINLQGLNTNLDEYLVKAIGVSGDWINIQAESLKTDTIINAGWIKWKDNDKLLISFYLLM